MSIHAPSQFLQQHWKSLLPAWTEPVQSVLIYLQSSPIPLSERSPATEAIKDQLRDSFLTKAQAWRQFILQAGFLAEPFDPKHGTPLYSQPGSWPLDDVAVAHALLAYPITEEGDCKILHHPQWDSSTFPSTLLSSAPPEKLRSLLLTNACSNA